MNNILRQIDAEDIVFYVDNQFKDIDRSEFMSVFDSLKEDGIILSDYSDMYWRAFSGVRQFGIDFRFDQIAYKSHFCRHINIPVHKFTDMLKCYVLYLAGVYVFSTIRDRLACIRDFVTKIGDGGYQITEEISMVIVEFLGFIGVADSQAEKVLKLVHFAKAQKSRQRTMSHMINYMALASEINDMYRADLNDQDFIHWFPVYFWVNITFIIPLRATEMLLTPLDCLSERDGEVYITLRRTQLKKRTRTVFYKVSRDYREFTYRVPDTKTIETIRKYVSLTRSHERKYLFDFGRYAVNRVFSLSSFNELLSEFVKTFLIGNRRYDYARFASGIEEFDIMSAGDSRPIAMANLYFQDVGADICRELANHVTVNTSAGYYTNVSETIYASSIMHLQRKINAEKQKTELYGRSYAFDIERSSMPGDSETAVDVPTENGCSSARRPYSTGDISNCLSEDHVHECLGCRYFRPTDKQLAEALSDRKQRLDEASRAVIQYMSDKDKIRTKDVDFDKLFLDAHTGIKRYRTACDEMAEKEARKWHRERNSQRTSCLMR